MSESREIALQPDIVDLASTHGIILPSLAVSSLLDTRMSRFNSYLSVDQGALYWGASALETENIVAVAIQPLRKDADAETPATLDYEYFRLNSNIAKVTLSMPAHIPAAKEKLSEVDRKLNIALWTGVLVGEKLLVDRQEIKDEKKKKENMTSLKGALTGMAVSGGNMIVSSAIIDYAPVSMSVAGISLIPQIAGWVKRFKLNSRSLEDYTESKFSDRIQEIASAYPVLSHQLGVRDHDAQ